MAITSPTREQLAAANKTIGATNALNELRERLRQAGLAAEYMELIDAYREEAYEAEQAAHAPIRAHIHATMPLLTDELVALYPVSYCDPA